jgi:hypothetical protein
MSLVRIKGVGSDGVLELLLRRKAGVEDLEATLETNEGALLDRCERTEAGREVSDRAMFVLLLAVSIGCIVGEVERCRRASGR